MLVTLFLFSFLLFCVFEWKPAWTRFFGLGQLHYYALRERYIPDDALVFRVRPFFKILSSDFKGELYHEQYQVKVEPIPSEYFYDQNSFRNSSEDDSYDLVVLGDSYAAVGHTEQDMFSKRLEKHTNLTAMNLGQGWYGPFQYLEVLKKYGLAKKPKVALFCFFEGNDLKDVREYLRWKNGGNYYHFNLTSKNFLHRYILALRSLAGFGKKRLGEVVRANIHPDLANIRLRDKDYKAIIHYRANEKQAEEILRSQEGESLRRLIREFKDICEARHIMPLIVFIPTKSHIYAEWTDEKSGQAWLAARAGEIRNKANVEKAVGQICEELRIPFIDLTPRYESLAREGVLLYHPFDTHWNSEGREAAARFVAQELEKRREI